MSTVVPPKGSRSVTAPPATSTQQYQPYSILPRNHQNHHRNAQANYSDIESNSAHQPSTPPRTPRRQEHITNTSETGSKQKSRNKKPKNVMMSPAIIKNGQNTPPLGRQQSSEPQQSSIKPILTPSTAAYAGPTFHASPAPSSLPIPSFYSKSVPESPGIKAINQPSQSPPDPPSSAKMHMQREESPLDFFFRADREEKARARSATLSSTKPTGPFSPPSGSPQTSQSPPTPLQQARPRNTKRISSSGMFAMELDGDNSTKSPYGPSFSTPYSERIKSARSTSSIDQVSKNGQQTMTSEALKAYLFSGHQTPSSSTPSGTHSISSGEGNNSSIKHTPTDFNQKVVGPGGHRNAIPNTRAHHNSMGRSSGLRQEVNLNNTPIKTPEQNSGYATSPFHMHGDYNLSSSTKTTAAPLPQASSPHGVPVNRDRNVDIKGMEDSLRKILKLDLGGSNVAGSNDHTASSGPNYAVHQ